MAKARKAKKTLHHDPATTAANTDYESSSDTEHFDPSIATIKDEDLAITEKTTIEATAEIAIAIEELKRLETLKKQLMDLEESHRQKITNFMGCYLQLKFGPFTLATWKSQSRKTFDSSSFKTDYADLYGAYLKETQLRVFRLC